MDLGPQEVRVLASLVEKGATTPDQYPLSINALVQACNQKSAREPVMRLAEGDVRSAVAALTQRGLVRQAPTGGRVSRFEHRLGDKPGTALRLAPEPLAVLCVLMLCGAQTPGQIRGRAQRLAALDSVEAVEAALSALAAHDDGPLAERLPREAGKREHRWRHCLGPADRAAAAPSGEAHAGASDGGDGGDQAGDLEARVAELERVVEQLQTWLQRD